MSLHRRDQLLYRRTNRILLFMLIVYLAIALERERVLGREEVFPIAGWSLFSLVPSEIQDYSLRITAIDNKPISPPLFFEEADQYFWAASDHPAHVNIRKLGEAFDHGEGAEIARLRRHIEISYLSGRGPVSYELVRRRYDVLERWHERKLRDVQALASFRTGEP